MKRISFLKASVFSVLISSIALFSVSCDKNDSKPNLSSKEFRLYNYSSGSAVDAGSFTIQQLEDSSASLTIRLSSGFYVPSVTLPAYIAVTDSTTGVELVYADLGTVDGSTGVGTTTPVKTSDNTPVNYNELISKRGYYVKVMNGTNVQARGDIQ